MTIKVTGPDGSNFSFPDGTPESEITGAMSKHYGGEAAADPVTTNKVVRAAATGVPIVGGVLNQLNAATNAALAPAFNPLFPEKDQLKGATFAERRAESLRQQNEADKKFEEAHPVIDTAAKITGGVAGSIPAMMAAPAAFGLTGTLPQMVARGAISNAALGGADAAIRGQDVAPAAAVGGAVGAVAPLVARGVGHLARGIKEYRNPTPPIAQNIENVAGVDVPLTAGQVASDPIKQAEEEIMRRGGRGTSAEAVAHQADEEAQRAVVEASGNIGRSLDPTGTSARTAPQAAGEVVQQELGAQAAQQEAAAAARAAQVAAEGRTLSQGLGGGAAPISPLDAGERVGAAVASRRDAKVAATQAAYKARDAVPGTFDESVPRGLAEDIRTRLNTGENPIWVDPTNESTANKALKLIDQTLGKDSGVFANAAGPKPPPGAAAAAPAAKMTEDETVAALRAKFGDTVADAYAKQTAAAGAKDAPPLSLLEFIASKGGMAPHPELDAIGLNHGHRSQIPGQPGFFGTVRKNGAEIDRMREAAQEAGYLRGAHGETSTPTQFLDAIDAELRGQKVYPEGHAGFQNKRAAAAGASRDAAERDAVMQGVERDLADAGYGELAPDVRKRAAALMHDEHLSPDNAVDTAMRHLEQEDAARAGAHAFPGDVPMGAAAAAAPRPVDLKVMDEARKRLVTMFGDAKSAAIRTGDKSDMRAMGKILSEFDNSISDALASGKFSGDAKLAQELQAAARKSHAEYRQTFSSRGPGDETGRAVEKILGRYTDSAATPDEIAALAYGSKSDPGGGKAVRIGMRLKEILGEKSPEWADYKQGLFSHITQTGEGEAARTPAQIADRIDKFLTGRGSGLAKVAFDGKERAQLAAYAKSLRTTEAAAKPVNEVEKAVARIAGTDGHLPASPTEVADMLFSRSGKGDKGLSVRLALRLKNDLKPESWSAVRQGMWEKLTNAGEGKIEFGPQALSQRLHEFLNESGKPLARVLFSKAERAEMAKLASVYKRMTPLRGTTNPSGTAPMLAKIAKKAGDNILALIGLGAHGVPGAIVGHAIQRGAEGLKDARAGKEAVRLFFGPQARRPVAIGRLPQLVGVPGVEASRR
jgi:hypothetical protein